MLIGFGWGLVAVLMYKVATTTYVEEKAWDPYDILGVSSGATEGDIKKVYRKLSLQYHPDKVAEADKKESESKFVDISKAYKVLTDEDARKNWEEWGNPDGRQCECARFSCSSFSRFTNISNLNISHFPRYRPS